MSTVRPSRSGRSASRKTAGDASCAAASGRTIKKSVSDDCAARCSRRSEDVWTYCDQNSNAPQLPARRICSADHKASAVLEARICNSCSGDRPMYSRPSPFGTCGGWTIATGRLPSALSAGRSSRISPTPACWTSRSISAPTGQPPPGSSADSAGYPVSTTRPRLCASWDARHRDGCISSARTAAVDIGSSKNLYIYTVSYTQFRDSELTLLSEAAHGCTRSQGRASDARDGSIRCKTALSVRRRSH